MKKKIAKAIEVLGLAQQQSKANDFVMACILAVQALCEKLQRLDGCRVCRATNEIEYTFSSWKGSATFCPSCGKKLGEKDE